MSEATVTETDASPAETPAETASLAPLPVTAASLKPPSPADPPAGSWATLWLTDRDLAVFAVLAVVVFLLAIARWAQLAGWGTQGIEVERLVPLEVSYRLDLNAATWVEFSQLDGVGESLALRIVEHRTKHGPFRSVDDLDHVAGIGPKMLERLRPYLTVEPPGPDGSR